VAEQSLEFDDAGWLCIPVFAVTVTAPP